MKIFIFIVDWDQPINYFFDQDDVKTIGHRRVRSEATVVAPDRELGELYLRRSLTYTNPNVTFKEEQPIHLFVEAAATTLSALKGTTPIGPEVLNELGKATQQREKRSYGV